MASVSQPLRQPVKSVGALKEGIKVERTPIVLVFRRRLRDGTIGPSQSGLKPQDTRDWQSDYEVFARGRFGTEYASQSLGTSPEALANDTEIHSICC